MATKIFMEALSPTMEEGRLVKWLKNEGDAVKSGDILAEVETDKAVMELAARGEGVLRKRLVNEGEAVPVGTLVGVIGAKDEDIAALVAGATKSDGRSKMEDVSPAAPTAAAPASPPPAVAPPTVPAATPSSISPSSIAVPSNGGRTLSSPLAKRLADEKGLDLARVVGSGPGGRIIKRDIEAAIATGPSSGVKPSSSILHPPSSIDFEDVPLTLIRKTIARRLSESIGPIPTFYLTAEFDLQRASEMRAAMAAMGDDYKVSFNDIILKATATALAQHPEVNAHWLGDRIRLHHRVHLGMAVATDDGLIVPVIFDADKKRMSEIAIESKTLAKKASKKTLKTEA